MSYELVEHDKLAFRLTRILVKLNDGESLDPLALADEFGVHHRTIQRDLNTRFASLVLNRVGGCYRLDTVKLGKLNLQDIERSANLAGVRGLFPKLTGDFTRELIERNTQGSLLVKGQHYEDLRGKEGQFSQLEQAISQHQRVGFSYIKPAGRKNYGATEPYKLVNNSGILYLAGKDGDKLKSWTFTKIENLQTLDTFSPNASVHDNLTKEDGIWLNGKKIEVVLKVSPNVADYFQRRSLIAHQVIEKKLEDSGLVVSCTVAHGWLRAAYFQSQTAELRPFNRCVGHGAVHAKIQRSNPSQRSRQPVHQHCLWQSMQGNERAPLHGYSCSVESRRRAPPNRGLNTRAHLCPWKRVKSKYNNR